MEKDSSVHKVKEQTYLIYEDRSQETPYGCPWTLRINWKEI